MEEDAEWMDISDMRMYVADLLLFTLERIHLFTGGYLLDKGYPSWAIAVAMIFTGGITTFFIILFTHIASLSAKHD